MKKLICMILIFAALLTASSCAFIKGKAEKAGDKADLDTALDWLLEEWLYKYDSSWTDHYTPKEFDFDFLDDEFGMDTFTLGAVEIPGGDPFRLEIRYVIKDGRYCLVSFYECY